MNKPNYGPRVAWEQLQPGVRIYYTGDMANASGEGIITARLPIDPRWGYRQVSINMDDGRKIKAIGLENFQPGPGRRFWLAVDWTADRKARIEASQAEMRRFIAAREAKEAASLAPEQGEWPQKPTGKVASEEAISPAPPAATDTDKPRPFAVGDILVSSWGYDQTNIDYYQIVRLTKASVIIREIKSEKDGGGWRGKVMPVKDAFIGPEMCRRIGEAFQGQYRIRIDSVSGARLWDGKPCSYTAYA